MNILYVLTNQMHRDALRCMGNPDVQTPHLDGLAHDGVLFRNAYTNDPECAPFCVNLLTGRYTCQIRASTGASSIPTDCRTLADVLNEGGYRTGYVGKWHVSG